MKRKYFALDGGGCLDDLYIDESWEEAARRVYYCCECLKVYPNVSRFEVHLQGKYTPFAVSGIGALLAGLINQKLIKQIGTECFHSEFYTSNVIINSELSQEYKVYFAKKAIYNLQGDHCSINEDCPCGRRKYLPLTRKGEPYMLQGTIPPEGLFQSNSNRLILRDDLFVKLEWRGLPKPVVSELKVRELPLDGDPTMF